MKVIIIGAFAAALVSGAVAQNDMKDMKMDASRYGGPVYNGTPALKVTSSLIKAGGGAENFSTVTALTHILGPKLFKAEAAKLTDQYGKDAVGSWLAVFDFAVDDAVKKAVAAGVKLPSGHIKGKALAVDLVGAGLDKDGTFYTEFMLDHAVTHQIHMAVMDDIDAKFGEAADANYHKITNQAMVDAAHALGAKSVVLPSFH